MSIRPKYRLTTQSFIDNALREEGEFIEYDGIPGSHMIPANQPARDAVKAAGARYHASMDPVNSLPLSSKDEIDPLS